LALKESGSLLQFIQ